jgi:hypothetical protein
MANKQISRPPNQQPTPPDPELLERFLSLQEAELATRTTELEIRRLEVQQAHEFSKGGLEAQLTDRQNDRIAKQTSDNYKYIFCGILALIIVGFLVFALWKDKDAIAKEIVQGVVLVGAGYLGGKYHQKSKNDKDKKE